MLYLCATPIGNLEDVTLRLVRVLKEADVIYAEDTRHTAQLLNHLDIKKPLVSFHEHNERIRAKQIVSELAEGKNIALVSDAGMPAISDPGREAVLAAIEAGEKYTVIPGPSAAVTALVMSGLPSERFAFEGFLPRKSSQMLEFLASIADDGRTLIFYESPLRLGGTLAALLQVLGDRDACVCRELTKVYEECVRGSLSELAARFEQPPKGECVILVSGASEAGETIDMESMLGAMREAVAAGKRPRDAAKFCARGSIGANELYKEYLRQQE